VRRRSRAIGIAPALGYSPTDVSDLNCLECGACCFQRPGTILISDADLVRWKRTQRHDILEQLDEGHFSQMAFRMGEHGACVHHGTVSEPHACRIYEERGDVCREFAAGSPQCHEFRADRGLEPRRQR
jgi:Fe-S-cluster containining protein